MTDVSKEDAHAKAASALVAALTLRERAKNALHVVGWRLHTVADSDLPPLVHDGVYRADAVRIELLDHATALSSAMASVRLLATSLEQIAQQLEDGAISTREALEMLKEASALPLTTGWLGAGPEEPPA